MFYYAVPFDKLHVDCSSEEERQIGILKIKNLQSESFNLKGLRAGG